MLALAHSASASVANHPIPFRLEWLTLSLTAVLPGLAFALTVLALTHRWERRHLLLAVAILGWFLLINRNSWVRVQPWHISTLELALGALITGTLVLMALRLMGIRRQLIDGLLPLQTLLMPLVPLLPGGTARADDLRAGFWTLLALELLGVTLWLLWRRIPGLWRHAGSMRFGVEQVLTPSLLLISVAMHAFTRGWASLQASLGLTSLLFLIQGALGLLNYAHTRRRGEAQLVHLEKRMQERLVEVEKHHKELADQRLDQVTERERKRIAGDLHDDLGAKLLTIVHTSDNERISTLAREALEEMRLSVRGLTGKPVQLLDAIGDWRAEVVSRLAQANIEVEWLSLDEEITYTLPARAYVQTTRIVRESVSNAIKHSEATRCVVRCTVADGDFQMVIQDNGRGIPTGIDGRLDKGHGMASMKSRAKQMQGQCLVESGPGWGTVIRLTIPL